MKTIAWVVTIAAVAPLCAPPSAVAGRQHRHFAGGVCFPEPGLLPAAAFFAQSPFFVGAPCKAFGHALICAPSTNAQGRSGGLTR
jgi:hypothetical protein